MWHDRLTKMMDYSNSLIEEFTKMIQEAFESMTMENTHQVVFHIVLFCKHISKKIGDEQEDLQRKRERRGPT